MMNQTLDIAARILASLVVSRSSGNPETQAIDALTRAEVLLYVAKARGIDTTDYAPPVVHVTTTAPETIKVSTGFTPPTAPADPKPLAFGAKRKS
jgi:hypothetical protein